MQKMTYTTAILTGGNSKRMGEDKAALVFDGVPLLKRLIRRFTDSDATGQSKQILLSVSKNRRYSFLDAEDSFCYVEDQYDQCGPLGGLHALLSECTGDWLFVTTVDLPLVDSALKEELLSYLCPGIDAVVPMDEEGRIHPLCALYHKRCLDPVTACLENKQLRVREFLQTIRVSYIPVTKLRHGKRKLFNMNTPKEYEALTKGATSEITSNAHGIPVLTLAAYSGSGKTTFLEQLIGELKQRHYTIAVLKHDGGHDFQIDYEGKDSWRFMKAGADAVLLVSHTKTAIMEYYLRSVEQVIDEIQGVDLILVEGYKFGPYPKLLLFRRDARKPVAMDLEQDTPYLILSDQRDFADIPCPYFDLTEISAVANEIERRTLS